jgi:L-histidine N-alpha-methyltransferase
MFMQNSGAWITESKPDEGSGLLDGLRQRGQKELPAHLLYDALGSALFDAITLLPEYGLTRADLRLIRDHAQEIREHGRPSLVIELGSGGGGKAKGILDVLAHQHPLRYCPVDVSADALRLCRLVFLDMPRIEVRPVEASYREGLHSALQWRGDRESALVLFLGSSIGNFSPQEAADLLACIRGQLRRGDLFLFSADLEKDEARMLAAYDDSLGVTAAFNLNVLARLNREMSATFDLARFEHVARYDSDLHRIEMHLRSLVDQVVAIGGGTLLTFRKGETIRSECSYKFKLPDIRKLCENAGFYLESQWIDWEWPLAQTLLRVV